MTAALERNGYAIVEGLRPDELPPLEVVASELAAPGRGGARNLLSHRAIQTLTLHPTIRTAVEAVLGSEARPVRGLLFDKTAESNWKVVWHQDVTVAVKERVDLPGYGPWSVKAGVVHVQPPTAILEHMLAVRVHIDECTADNGPLRVLQGSHRSGKLSVADIEDWRRRVAEVVCLVPAGGLLLMRPLLLHASSPAQSPRHRRVIHLEFAAAELHRPLCWSEALPNHELELSPRPL